MKQIVEARAVIRVVMRLVTRRATAIAMVNVDQAVTTGVWIHVMKTATPCATVLVIGAVTKVAMAAMTLCVIDSFPV